MRALINRDYTRLWFGQAVSVVGDEVYSTTLALWVATKLGRGQTWAPAAVSGVLLAAGAAILVVGPLAGVFVDRWRHKRLMLRTEVVRASLVAALAILAFLPQRTMSIAAWLTVIYVTVFLVNAAGQFFSPARLAILGGIVPGDVDRARAAGIEQSTQAVAAIIGPPLAAPLLFTIGVQWALVANAASYVVSYLAIRSIRGASIADEAAATEAVSADAQPVVAQLVEAQLVEAQLVEAMAAAEQTAAAEAASTPVRGSYRQEFADGLRFLVTSRLLLGLLVMGVVAQLGTGALNTLSIFFITDNLHTPARLFGVLSTAFGIGAVVGGLCSGRVVRWIGARNLLWMSAAGAGVVVLVYARQTAFAPALLLFGLLALVVTLLNTAFTPLLLKAVPPQFLGRVMAVFMPANSLSQMLSMAIAGWLASSALRGLHRTALGVHIGPVDTIFSAAALLMIAAGLLGILVLPREAATEAPPAGPAVLAAEAES